jgi:hypothetical protein
VPMPRHYIDEEWNRDALFTSRNLVGLEFAAEHLKVTLHAVERPSVGPRVPLHIRIAGGYGQVTCKYRDAYVDMGPSTGPTCCTLARATLLRSCWAKRAIGTPHMTHSTG